MIASNPVGPKQGEEVALERQEMSTPCYVQFGCGWSAPCGWLNFDASPTLRFERLPLLGKLYVKNKRLGRFPDAVHFGNVVTGLPLADGSADGVYASHVLEHLSREDFETALGETFRILAPGGIFRLVVPDLERHARTYIAALERGDTDANDHFMRGTLLGLDRRPKGLVSFVAAWLGNSSHLWMWDFPSLATRLTAHGFVGVRRAHIGDCEDPSFATVEDETRFEGHCAVEARRPAATTVTWPLDPAARQREDGSSDIA